MVDPRLAQAGGEQATGVGRVAVAKARVAPPRLGWVRAGGRSGAGGWSLGLGLPGRPAFCRGAMPRGALLLVLAAGPRAADAAGPPRACDAGAFPHSLAQRRLLGGDRMVRANSSAAACLQACCEAPWCTAWNIQLSSTDPAHTPLECWLAAGPPPAVAPAASTDVWAGGSKLPLPAPHESTGEGAVIQPLSKWFYYGSTAPTTLLRELTDQSIAALRARAANVSRLSGAAAWRAHAADVAAKLEKVFAPLPPPSRTVPNYTVVATLQRPGYSCSKILYETRPGFWVPGALWVPAGLNAADRRPGVLVVSGHSPDGFRSNALGGSTRLNAPAEDDYEVVQINLVARGFVVLAFDPIGQGERMQYADLEVGAPDPARPWSAGRPGAWLWGSTSDHEYIGRQLLLNGVGLMSFWLHDEVVSLDLLAAHPAVNPEALGVVGCSGGGTQSSYLGAMDPRVKAASVACYMSSFEVDRLWAAGGGSDGEQTWPRGVALGLDKADLIEVRADRATQVLITTGDTCFPAAGGLEAVREARPAYAALGGWLDAFTAVWHHGWVLPTREQISGFFCRALRPGFPGGAPPPACGNDTEIDVAPRHSDFAEWSDHELQVTSTGQVVTAPECGAAPGAPAVTVHNFSAALTAQSLAALADRRAADPASFLREVARDAPGVAGYQQAAAPRPPRFLGAQFPSPHPPGLAAANATAASGLVERWMLFGEGSCFSVVTLFFPRPVMDMMTPRRPMPAVVLYRRARADLAAGIPDDVAAYNHAGYVAAAVDPCGLGEAGDAFVDGLEGGRGQAAEDMAHELGRSIPGLMAGDMARAHAYLRARPDISAIVAAVAADFLDVALLHAALAAPAEAPPRLVLVAPRSSLAAAASARLYQVRGYYSWVFGVLAHYDLADCVAAAAAANTSSGVLVLGPVDGASLAPLDAAAAAAEYAFAARAAGRQLTVAAGTFAAGEVAARTIAWLGEAARATESISTGPGGNTVGTSQPTPLIV